MTNPLKMKVNDWFATWLPGQFEELTRLREGQAALQQQVSCTGASRHHDSLFQLTPGACMGQLYSLHERGLLEVQHTHTKF